MPGHDNLAQEAGALLDVIAARLQKATATEQPHDRARCAGCPLCVALTYLDDHRDLSAQLAQGALAIVGALRQYLDASATDRETAPESVQHIDIR